MNTTLAGDCAPFVQAPDFDVHKPSFTLPAAACDSHAHVCGSLSVYPCFPDRLYSPVPEATLENYRTTLATLGVKRAVLVQPSFYGADNRALLDGLKAMAQDARGVAVLNQDVTSDEIERLHAAGVRGVRFNVVDVKSEKGVLPMERLRNMADRVAPFGWHVELLMHVNEFPDMDQMFANFPTDIVVGHLGYVPAHYGPENAGFQALIRLMRDGKAWAKLTGPYRISAEEMPHKDITPFAHALLDAAPNQLVWGSDWPHVKLSWSIPMPNDGEIVDLLCAWGRDEQTINRILVDNPARLYGFD